MKNKTYSYKKLYNIRDMLNASNELHKNLSYIDTQFEEDLKNGLPKQKQFKMIKVNKFIERLE